MSHWKTNALWNGKAFMNLSLWVWVCACACFLVFCAARSVGKDSSIRNHIYQMQKGLKCLCFHLPFFSLLEGTFANILNNANKCEHLFSDIFLLVDKIISLSIFVCFFFKLNTIKNHFFYLKFNLLQRIIICLHIKKIILKSFAKCVTFICICLSLYFNSRPNQRFPH